MWRRLTFAMAVIGGITAAIRRHRDEMSISRLTVTLAARGSAHFETLPAIDVDEMLKIIAGTDAAPEGAG